MVKTFEIWRIEKRPYKTKHKKKEISKVHSFAHGVKKVKKSRLIEEKVMGSNGNLERKIIGKNEWPDK